LPEPARADLLGLGTPVAYDPGRTILRQGGDEGEDAYAYLLLAGSVKVLGNEGGREPLLGIRIGGDLVGEMAVLSGKARSATVSTCAPTLARHIPGWELRAFLRGCSEVAVEVACMVIERLRWANERRVDFAAFDARTRVGRVLLTLAETYGRDVGDGRDLGAPLSREEIASLAGVKLATMEKALREFAKAGLVRLGYRSIVVIDADGLGGAARRTPGS
jgi:CRP-like cAMP-binding protein